MIFCQSCLFLVPAILSVSTCAYTLPDASRETLRPFFNIPPSSSSSGASVSSSSRLNRLLGAYNNIKLAALHQLFENPQSHNVKTDVSNNFQDSDSIQVSLEQADKNVLSKITKFGSNRRKRQQGWFVQYGKRDSANAFPTNQNAFPTNEIAFPTNQIATLYPSINKVAGNDADLLLEDNLLSAAEQKLENDVDLKYANTDSSMDDVYDEDGLLVDSETRKGRHSATGSELGLGAVKRQQGWYIHYGKRSERRKRAGIL